MAAPSALVSLVEPWSRLYSDSTLVPVLVVFGHVAALMFAGGMAVTLDRATLKAYSGDAAARAHQLDALGAAHPFVLAGLATSAVTGVLLFAADLETYFGSWIFWTKMALIVFLLANGYGITKAEAQARTAPATAGEAWSALRRTAIASMVLWFAIVLAGVALVKAA